MISNLRNTQSLLYLFCGIRMVKWVPGSRVSLQTLVSVSGSDLFPGMGKQERSLPELPFSLFIYLFIKAAMWTVKSEIHYLQSVVSPHLWGVRTVDRASWAHGLAASELHPVIGTALRSPAAWGSTVGSTGANWDCPYISSLCRMVPDL